MKIDRNKYWKRKHRLQLWFRQFTIIPQTLIILFSFGFIVPNWEYNFMIKDVKKNIAEEREFRDNGI